MKLQYKIIRLIFVVLLVVGLAGATAMLLLQRQSAIAQFERSALTLAVALQGSLEHDMLEASQAHIQDAVIRIAAEASVNEVVILSRTQQVYASGESSEIGETRDDPEIARVLASGETITRTKERYGRSELAVIFPVMNQPACYTCHGSEAKILGAVEVGLDRAPLSAQLREQALLLLLIGGLTVFGVGGALIVMLRSEVVNPLSKLAAAAGRIARGDFTARAAVETEDEVGLVAHTFNEMAERVEATLRRSTEFSETVMSTINDAISIINVHDYTIAGVNDAFLQRHGLKEAEVIGQTCHLVTHHRSEACRPPDDICPLLATVNSGQHATAEHVHYAANDEKMYVEVTTSPIRDENGKILQVVHVSRDITERRWAEEALRESEERYRHLVELSPDTVVVHSEGKIAFMNTAGAKLLGARNPEQLIGRPIMDFLHPDYRNIVKGRIRRISAEGEEASLMEEKFIRLDGAVIDVDVAAIPFTYEGKPAVQAIVRDITERKRVEEALRESEERYRALVDLGGEVGEAVVMMQDTEQADGIQTFVSDEWPRITGYSREELLGTSFFDLVCPQDRQASLERHRRKMKGESIAGLFEMSINRKDGTEVPIELTSAYTTYNGERANVAYIRDITGRKRAAEREKRMQQELNLSSRLASIGELAAGVAHEINNPLTGIIGFSQLLLRRSTDEKTSRDLERIHNEAQRAARVVQNLLTFARRRQPMKEYADINEVLTRTLELRTYELETSNIKVVTTLAPGLPEAMVDFQQMQQVFLNIILNAEQAMTAANQGGKLTIRTRKMKDCIRISFADNGPGIPAEYLDKLFDPFFTTKGDKGGTGLGLSVCHGIIVEHGGRIYVQSEPGKGTTFFVELPLSTKETDKS